MGKTILGKVGFTPCGEWVQGAYSRLDLVSYQGNSFVSLEDNNTTLLTDASRWMVIASKGAKGDKGDKGDIGATGPRGEIGPQGEIGLRGEIGPQGEIGPKGDGLDYTTMTPEDIAKIKGKSAYEVAVENGFIGSEGEWLKSLKGEKGDQGSNGDRGVQGEKGDQGIQGLQGEKGEKGDQGDIGPVGAQGLKGDKGDRGEPGVKGDQGIQGEVGPQGSIGPAGPGFTSDNIKKVDRIGSRTASTTVANLDVNIETILVTLSANASLSASLTGTAYDTWETHVFVLASGADRTITIPTSGNYISMCGSSVTIPSGKWCEFSLKCIGGIWHVARMEQE